MSANPEWQFKFPKRDPDAPLPANVTGPFRELALQVLFPEAPVTIVAECPGGPKVLLGLELNLDAGEPVCFSLTFEPGISRTDAGSINIKKLIEGAVRFQTTSARAIVDTFVDGVMGEDGRYVFGRDDTHDTLNATRALLQRRSITDALLREVAEVYNADTTGAPTDAVKFHFSVTKRTATRWVAIARERGFIPEYVRSKKEDTDNG